MTIEDQAAAPTQRRIRLGMVGGGRDAFIGADFDDSWAAWLNGDLIFCHTDMPTCTPDWDAHPPVTEPSNGPYPDYGVLTDVSTAALAALQTGTNVLAVGVWNQASNSSDLVLVPKLAMNVDRKSSSHQCWKAR